jgi:hypothetical protein
MRRERWTKYLPVLVFLLYFLLGMGVHKDYGLSWDEPISRLNGWVSLSHVVKKVNQQTQEAKFKDTFELHSYVDRDYGVAIELPLAAAEHFFGMKEDRKVYQFRHAITFTLCFLGGLAVYSMARRRYESMGVGLLALGIYVFSPRLFAESFYNSKDMVFMAAFAIAMFSLYRLMETPSLKNALLHGLLTAFAMDIRVQGVVMWAATVGVFGMMAIKSELSWKTSSIRLAQYTATLVLFTILMWPLLWENPLQNFLDTLHNMSHFRWDGNVLYLGQSFNAAHLPWHYLPVYIALTIPLPHLLAVGLGAMAILGHALSGRTLWTDSKSRFDFVVLMFFVAPIAGVIALHSVLYDGWRQMYFVFGPLVLLSVRGVEPIIRRWGTGGGKPILLSVMAGLMILPSLVWTVRNHPLQNVYFNALAPSPWHQNFDVDYWGLANKRVLRAILQDKKEGPISVKVLSATPLQDSMVFFGPGDRDRVSFVQDMSSAMYLMSNFRSQSEISPELTDEALAAHWTVMHQQIVGGELIAVVYKRRPV